VKKAKSKRKALPPVVFIRFVGGQYPYMAANTNLKRIMSIEGKNVIGEYKLVKRIDPKVRIIRT
jgi:hypothetical protein